MARKNSKGVAAYSTPPGKFGIHWPTLGGVVRGWVQAVVNVPGSAWEVGNAAIRAAVTTWVAVTVLRAMGVALPG